MKRFVLLSLAVAFISFNASAQLPVDEKTKKVTFQDVVTADGLSAKDVYTKALAWGSALGFQLVAKESGVKIQWSGTVNVKYPSVQRGGYENGKVHFSVIIYCKDGRYKYKFVDFTHKARHANCGNLESEKSECTRFQLVPASWDKIKAQTKEKVEEYIRKLKATVKKEQVIIQDDDNDW